MPSRRLLRAAVTAGVIVGALVGGTVAYAALATSVSQSAGAYSTKHIFPTTDTVAAFDLEDASGGGAETFNGSPAAFNDGTLYQAANKFPTSYNAAKYLEFTMSSPLAAGLSVSSPQLTVGLRDGQNGASHQACYYVELRRASSSALLGTYGSSGSPLGCATSNATTLDTTTALSGVTTSSIADDLLVRAYVWTDAPARDTVVDDVSITGSTPFASFTLLPSSITDVTGSSTTVPAPLTAIDATYAQSLSSFQTTFSASRYVRTVFPATVPTSATITAATLTIAYRPASAANTLCFYAASYNGATLLATHGSSGSPLGCATGAAFTAATVSLPEISTDPAANAASVRLYFSSNATGPAQLDQATLAVGYYLN